jgi:hypothetical protein
MRSASAASVGRVSAFSPYWGRIVTTTTNIDVWEDAPEIRESSVVEVLISASQCADGVSGCQGTFL